MDKPRLLRQSSRANWREPRNTARRSNGCLPSRRRAPASTSASSPAIVTLHAEPREGRERTDRGASIRSHVPKANHAGPARMLDATSNPRLRIRAGWRLRAGSRVRNMTLTKVGGVRSYGSRSRSAERMLCSCTSRARGGSGRARNCASWSVERTLRLRCPRPTMHRASRSSGARECSQGCSTTSASASRI